MTTENKTGFSDEAWKAATEWRDARDYAGLGYIADGELAALLSHALPPLIAEELKEILSPNEKDSGAGTASAGLPGYAGDNNGERK